MKPYYKDEYCTIYHGDSKDFTELNSVDLVITDPPYGIGEAKGKNKSRSQIAQSTDYGNLSWDDNPINYELLTELLCIGEFQCCFGGNYYPMPPSSCWLVWDKVNYGNDFADCELAWTNYPSAVRMKKHQWSGMLRKNREARIGHPTQKPLDVISWAIQLAPKYDTILDPFMGSGTTLRASKDLQRKCIGIELEEKYCEIAAKRLEQEVLDLKF